MPRACYILAFLSALPVSAAMASQQPFPNITFAAFNAFVVGNFNPDVSLATVLLVLFTMTENSDLLNLHARHKNPQCMGEEKRVSSGWIKALARGLDDRLKANTNQLFKNNELPINFTQDNLVQVLITKLDELMDVLELNPFSKSGRLKKELKTISHNEIAAVHVICPISMQCEDVNCDPRALQQSTRYRDIPKVTLIKGTTVYKDVAVLSGKCPKCDTIYYADHESLDRNTDNQQKLYLNSAKYLKLGQSLWVDRVFSNAVLSGMYSFHASAAAYTEYWNNSYSYSSSQPTTLVTRRLIWQAFVQESIRTIGSAVGQHLTTSDNLPIDAVTFEAFQHLGQNGIISAANGHACSECTQPYRRTQYESLDQIEEGRASVKMIVMDGIVMGPTHCAYEGCTSDLQNARGGAFCGFHEIQHGAKCRICGCERNKVNSSQACDLEQHQAEFKKYTQSHSRETMSGVKRMLKHSGENLAWLPTPQRTIQPHDQVPNSDIPRVKHYFGPGRFYCVETICAPCGVVIAWTKFDRSESESHIVKFLSDVYPTEDSRPDYVCIDKACLVLRHIVAQGKLEEWQKTTRFIVDTYHYINHSPQDIMCRTWCNPNPLDGSAPNLVIPAVDKDGNPVLKRAFNTQVS
jgi:hypothetical protein